MQQSYAFKYNKYTLYNSIKFFNYKDSRHIYYTIINCWLWMRDFEMFRVLFMRILRHKKRSRKRIYSHKVRQYMWRRSNKSKFKRNFIWIGIYVNRSFSRKSLGSRMGHGSGSLHSKYTALRGGTIMIKLINLGLYMIRRMCIYSYGWTFRIRYGGHIFINTFYSRFMLW